VTRLSRPTGLVVLAVGLVLGLLLAGRAVGGDDVRDSEPAVAEGGLVVVASTTVLGDLVRTALGPDAEVRSIVPHDGDPHSFEPAPSDVRLIGEAHLVVMNGLGLEPWLEAIVGVAPSVLRVGEVVAEEVLLREVEGEVDPHLWMVPSIAGRYVEVIAARVSELRPDLEQQLRQRADAAVSAMRHLEADIESMLAVIPPERRIIVTTHDSQGYFAERFDFEVLTLVGASTEETPSARQQRRVIDRIRAAGVPAVFLEEHVSPALMQAIARDAGVIVGGVLHGDSLSAPGQGPEDYAAMLHWNAMTLIDGLGEPIVGSGDVSERAGG
jgi:ABC-type Zn uptake system ZnuABC Zn-binding protein ZnuA